MNPPPLAIVQARIGSTRLPRKMLLDLGGHPLIWWAWNASCDAFGPENVVVAMPASEENDELEAAVLSMQPYDTGTGFAETQVFRWDGPENDVLGRFHACAHRYRWHQDSVIVRVTPDDPFKVPELMRRVANGERHPVELGGEAFTLAMLDAAHDWFEVWDEHDPRQHITHALFRAKPPPPPPGVWTVDTMEDLEAARRTMDCLDKAGAIV